MSTQSLIPHDYERIDWRSSEPRKIIPNIDALTGIIVRYTDTHREIGVAAKKMYAEMFDMKRDEAAEAGAHLGGFTTTHRFLETFLSSGDHITPSCEVRTKKTAAEIKSRLDKISQQSQINKKSTFNESLSDRIRIEEQMIRGIDFICDTSIRLIRGLYADYLTLASYQQANGSRDVRLASHARSLEVTDIAYYQAFPRSFFRGWRRAHVMLGVPEPSSKATEWSLEDEFVRTCTEMTTAIIPEFKRVLTKAIAGI